MIDFEIAPLTREFIKQIQKNGKVTRELSRYYDDYEHEHDDLREEDRQVLSKQQDAMRAIFANPEKKKGEKGSLTQVILAMMGGGGGLPSGTNPLPGMNRGLGNAAIAAVATDDQKTRFGKLFAAMAITEPCCGSDTASIQTTAKLDEETNEWIINGTKIFVTSGVYCEAVVVWASLDRSRGRAAIKSFVIEKFREGITVAKAEDKLGIRSSDTAVIVLEDCRIPFDNILGSPEIVEKKGGFRGVMATFDATRPAVAAGGVNNARASLEYTKEKLEEAGYTFPYDKSYHELNAVQKDILDMEAMLDASAFLVMKAAALMDERKPNNLEASAAKAKAGKAANVICQKCAEILGPLGYSRELLAEKWMRDCKIVDLYEGTGQINTLIVARRILGFNRDLLK